MAHWTINHAIKHQPINLYDTGIHVKTNTSKLILQTLATQNTWVRVTRAQYKCTSTVSSQCRPFTSITIHLIVFVYVHISMSAISLAWNLTKLLIDSCMSSSLMLIASHDFYLFQQFQRQFFFWNFLSGRYTEYE